MNVLVDSSAVLALLNRRDAWHEAAVSALGTLARQGAALLMTNFLIAETHALLLARLGRDLAREWLLTYDWNVLSVTPGDERLAVEIIRRYQDKDFSYTDATSFAVMERHNIPLVFTFDRHFRQFGLPVVGEPETSRTAL
ncbi:MAG: PIN domain-containing protein [Thermoanaerobacterales bacterium]|nr:PIN domain-containing protein [Thermoanaerobacterales bacterium]